jgi:hypothetical protein
MAAHATILRYLLPHAALSAAVVSGVVIFVVIKHLGLLGSLFALFRRQSRIERHRKLPEVLFNQFAEA